MVRKGQERTGTEEDMWNSRSGQERERDPPSSAVIKGSRTTAAKEGTINELAAGRDE